MRIYRDINTASEVRDLLWSGGADTLEDLDDDEIEEILSILESEDTEWDETELNDFFWFERDTIAEWLGFYNYDELMSRSEFDKSMPGAK